MEKWMSERSENRKVDGILETDEEFWEWLVAHQGEEFFTAKGLVFTYQIRGGEMFVDRRSKSVTRATVCGAFERIRLDENHEICGPKALNCFGAPYLWAILVHLGLAIPGRKKRSRSRLRADSADLECEASAESAGVCVAHER